MSIIMGAAHHSLIAEIEQFLYEEADLLDAWRLHEWLDLFLPSGQYLVPSTVNREGNPNSDLFLVQDDRFLLEQRVNSLQTRAAHAEYPHSRTRRLITNVRAGSSEETIDVIANFAIYRFRRGTSDVFVGQYRHQLVRTENGALKYRVRKSVLDLEALRPHGKVSFIL